MIVKMCISPHTNQPVRVCDREEDSMEPGRMKCCVCVGTRDYVEVDKFKEWVELLNKEGINSKRLVKDQMMDFLQK